MSSGFLGLGLSSCAWPCVCVHVRACVCIYVPVPLRGCATVVQPFSRVWLFATPWSTTPQCDPVCPVASLLLSPTFLLQTHYSSLQGDCHYKVPQTEFHKQQKFVLMVVEARSPKSRLWQGLCLQEALWEKASTSLWASVLLAVHAGPGLEATSFQYLPVFMWSFLCLYSNVPL